MVEITEEVDEETSSPLVVGVGENNEWQDLMGNDLKLKVRKMYLLFLQRPPFVGR